MKWFVKCIRNYVNFSGRARRKEYWFFILFSVIFAIVARLLDWWIFGSTFQNPTFPVVSFLLGLFLLLPQLAVMVRRLHDTGHSGHIVLWYYIFSIVWFIVVLAMGASYFFEAMSGNMALAMPLGLTLVAGIGALVIFVWALYMLVLFCIRGDKGPNKYGPDPIGETELTV